MSAESTRQSQNSFHMGTLPPSGEGSGMRASNNRDAFYTHHLGAPPRAGEGPGVRCARSAVRYSRDTLKEQAMQSLVWEAPRVMNMREQERPAPGTGEALVKVAYVGICGSELSGYLGHNALRVPPLVMGHEFAGEVVALGDGVAAKRPDLTV